MSAETQTCSARFSSRAAADRAVEHLIQQLAIDPTEVDIHPIGAFNSAGETASGGDAEPSVREDSPLEGALLVTVSGGDPVKVLRVLHDAGGEEQINL